MLLVITNREKIRGKYRDIVSHGINLDNDEVVVLPQEEPYILGAVFDLDIGEYVIYGK